MTAATAPPITRTAHVDGRALLDVSVLRSRAADLRVTAADIAAPLSTTYRRRAAELELEAAALAARFGLLEDLTLAA